MLIDWGLSSEMLDEIEYGNPSGLVRKNPLSSKTAIADIADSKSYLTPSENCILFKTSETIAPSIKLFKMS